MEPCVARRSSSLRLAFEVRAGDGPEPCIKVEISPAHGAQVAGALEQYGGYVERCPHHRAAAIAVAGAQQFAQLGWVGDGWEMALLAWFEGFLDVLGNVPCGAASGDCVLPDS